MSKETTSLRVPVPPIELGTLATCALGIDTRQRALTVSRQVAKPCGIRKARPHFAVSRPGALQQAPLPHR
jgi:hypothetical protein